MKSTENKTSIKWRFDIKSFIIFISIFIIEVLIAKFVNDSIIRPYGGDVLVVVLIYYFIKSFIQVKSLPLVIGVVAFACFIELGQYFNLVEILGLKNNKIMRVIIGSSFSWGDILAYIIGGSICYFTDRHKD